jgi:arylsulfatase A-like enzyme
LLIRVLLAIALVFVLGGCAEPRRPPNLVLIVVDALRADALGCYGNPDGTSPVLDALAARGVQFRTCISQAPWALPSVASILTGRFPSGHGANRVERPVAPGVPLLAEAIAPSGRVAGAVIGNRFLQAKHGLDRGFAHFDVSPAGDATTGVADGVSRSAVAWISTLGKRPFFLFLVYMDPHDPWVARPGAKLPAYEGPLGSGQDIWELRDQRSELGPSDLAFLRALYHGEVRATDSAIGELVDHLGETGRLDETIFLITADHGELLGEHGWIGHTRSLHAGVLEVPLVITAPQHVPAELRADPAMLVDLLPTVLQLLGQAPTRTAGRGLLGPDRAERALYSEVTYDPQSIPQDPDPARSALRTKELTLVAGMRSLVRGDWKAIHDRLTDTWRLYDLASDPGETRDVAASRPDMLDDLRQAFPEPGAFDVPAEEALAGVAPEEMERLRAAGYVR